MKIRSEAEEAEARPSRFAIFPCAQTGMTWPDDMLLFSTYGKHPYEKGEVPPRSGREEGRGGRRPPSPTSGKAGYGFLKPYLASTAWPSAERTKAVNLAAMSLLAEAATTAMG